MKKIIDDKISNSHTKLKKYCEEEGYKGWDPYDGLNSKFFNTLPFIRSSRVFRLIWIQLFKRNPINLRNFFLIEKDYNPKGLALFLSSYIKLQQIYPGDDNIKKIRYFKDKILELQSTGYSGACWGYNFPWESRAFYQPKYSPTVVTTTFVANALLDDYELNGDAELLKVCESASNFILNDLNRYYDEDGDFIFSYSPIDHAKVFNASLLGAKFLARMYSKNKNILLKNEAKKLISFCVKHQHNDGSWPYGMQPFHQWIDNFHTGYNLECISEYQRYTEDQQFERKLQKGMEYYLKTFFTEEGIPKYYNKKIYPINVHAPAQLVITLSKNNILDEKKELCDRVLHWTIDHLQSSKGYFYYEKYKNLLNRNSYMRWSQAWMFYALTEYIYYFNSNE